MAKTSLEEAEKWFAANNLTLNRSKTLVLTVTTKLYNNETVLLLEFFFDSMIVPFPRLSTLTDYAKGYLHHVFP